MSSFPWLTVIGAIPLAGALAIAIIPATGSDDRRAQAARDLVIKQVALVAAVVTLGMTVAVALKFSPSGPDFQIVQVFFALMLVVETMVIGVFAATDVLLFYVFFEAMLIPMYFMIGSYGVGQRQYAAVKFLLYSLLGGLLMLVAVIALYVYSTQGGHQGTFLFGPLTHLALSTGVERWLFLGFFIAFAVKAPLWPFHTCLPDAATSAQPCAPPALPGSPPPLAPFRLSPH